MTANPEHSDLQKALEEIRRLEILVESSKLMNSSLDGRALYDSILEIVRRELGVERGTLFFVDEARGEIYAKIKPEAGLTEVRLPIGQGIAGSVAATGDSILIHDAYQDPRFDSSADRASGFQTRSVLCAPIRNRDGKIVGVLQLLNKRGGPFSSHDLQFLESLSHHMAIAMENVVYHLTLLERNRIEQELRLARDIQAQILPDPPDDIESVELAASSRSCTEIGGDCYDFLRFPNGELGIVIFDVSGKGVAGALINASVQAALRAYAESLSGLGELVARLNELLYAMTRGRKYVTLFFGRYSPSNGSLSYVNAGHTLPLLHDGTEWQKLSTTGRPAGLLPSARYEEKKTVIPPGGALVLYTDGVTEACRADDEEFGLPRLLEAVEGMNGATASEIRDTIMQAVAAFEGEQRPADDTTIVVMRRRER